MLPIRPLVQDDQSVLGLCLEVAHCYGKSLRATATMLDVLPTRNPVGSSFGAALPATAAATLHRLIGLPQERTPWLVTAGFGHKPGGGATDGIHTAFCPRCLRNDPWQVPVRWRLPGSRSCPIHGILLARACPGCGQAPWSVRRAWGNMVPIPGRCQQRTTGGVGCNGLLPSAATHPSSPDEVWAQAELDRLYRNDNPQSALLVVELLRRRDRRERASNECARRAGVLAYVTGRDAPSLAAKGFLSSTAAWHRATARSHPAAAMHFNLVDLKRAAHKTTYDPAWLPLLLPASVYRRHLVYDELTADWWQARRMAAVLCWRVGANVPTPELAERFGLTAGRLSTAIGKRLDAFTANGRMDVLQQSLEDACEELRDAGVDFRSRRRRPLARLLQPARQAMPALRGLTPEEVHAVLGAEWAADIRLPEREILRKPHVADAIDQVGDRLWDWTP